MLSAFGEFNMGVTDMANLAQQAEDFRSLTEDHARPSDEDFVARARSIGDLIRANADEGEKKRRTPESSIEAMQEQGLFKISVPRRYGGFETSMKTMMDVISTIGEYDGGTAWTLSLINACNWIACLYPVKAQDEIWGDNPDARVSGVFAPSCKAVKVDGGWRLTGKWFYNSGGLHTQWAVLGFPEVDQAGEVQGFGFALIPREDLTLEDTWYTVGMRASGSNCLVADDVFVPEYRTISGADASEGRNRNELSEQELFYQSAFMPLLVLILIAPQLGLCREALRIAKEGAETKGVHGTTYKRQKDSVAFQMRLAKAALKVDTAHLHAYRSTADIDDAAKAGEYPDFLIRARIQADCGLVAEIAREAIDMCISAHGAGSFAETHVMQRLWRDSNIAGRHAFINGDARYETYGKALLGIDEKILALI